MVTVNLATWLETAPAWIQGLPGGLQELLFQFYLTFSYQDRWTWFTDGLKVTFITTIGALLLRGATDEESLLAFYSDTDYPPAREGETVTLDVREADEASLDALRQAGLYEEGAEYWFVYVTSAPAA